MENRSFTYGYSSERQREIESIKNKYKFEEKTPMGIKEFFKKAFSDMKESAKEQHKVDKANFAAAKAEAKANFEENRFTNTFRKAKADAKKTWDDAHMSPSERSRKAQEEREAQIKAANERIEAANERYNNAKVK
jgi:hypothetical protein